MTDDRLPWFPCYPSKLLGALAGMKADEGYVYWIVCLRIYETGKSCRDTIDALSRRTGLNRKRVSDALDLSFQAGRLTSGDDGIMNPFAAGVMADTVAFREERSKAGKKGADRRWKKPQENQTKPDGKANAQPMANDSHLHLQLEDSLFPNGNRHSGKPSKPMTQAEIDRKELFDRGKIVLGEGAGGMIQNLLAAKHGNIALARAAIEQASTMDSPRQYVGGILKGGSNGKTKSTLGGFSGLGARLRQSVADEEQQFGPTADPQPARRR